MYNTSLEDAGAGGTNVQSDLSNPHLMASVRQEAVDLLTESRWHHELFSAEGFQDPCGGPWTMQVLQNVMQPHVDCIVHTCFFTWFWPGVQKDIENAGGENAFF